MSVLRRALSGLLAVGSFALSGVIGLATGSGAALDQAPWGLSPANMSCALVWGAAIGVGIAAPFMVGIAGRTARLTLLACALSAAFAAALSFFVVSLSIAC